MASQRVGTQRLLVRQPASSSDITSVTRTHRLAGRKLSSLTLCDVIDICEWGMGIEETNCFHLQGFGGRVIHPYQKLSAECGRTFSGYIYVAFANKLFPTSHRLATRWTVRGSNRGRFKWFYILPNVRNCSRAHTASSSTGTGVVYGEVNLPGRAFNELFPSNAKMKHDCTRRLLSLHMGAFM
jgi:hypothetical protein